jgi:hypothetical protein
MDMSPDWMVWFWFWFWFASGLVPSVLKRCCNCFCCWYGFGFGFGLLGSALASALCLRASSVAPVRGGTYFSLPPQRKVGKRKRLTPPTFLLA